MEIHANVVYESNYVLLLTIGFTIFHYRDVDMQVFLNYIQVLVKYLHVLVKYAHFFVKYVQVLVKYVQGIINMCKSS